MQNKTTLMSTFGQTLDASQLDYLNFHWDRFTYLTREVIRLAALHNYPNSPVTIMDIGPHFQTTLIREALGPSAIIHTLGWENVKEVVPPGTVNKHFLFDLNDSPFQDRWIDCPQHDIVVMAEVFEHLYTAPEYFLGFIRKLLKPGGHLLIGTPNAVSLSRRIGMLKGRNPFERIRVTLHNPGHFREYTVNELQDYAHKTGFSVESHLLADFYESTWAKGLIKRYVDSLKDCIHIVYQKTDQPDKPLDLIIW